jgi:hypothetical protein
MMPDARTTDALQLLHEEHDRIREAYAQYQRETDPETSRGIADNLIAEVELHSLIEQEIVYPAVQRLVGDEDPAKAAGHSLAEAERLAEQLEGLDPDSAGFDAMFNEFAQHFTLHMQTVEEKMFPVLRRLGDEELITMAAKMKKRREEALTDLKKHGPGSHGSLDGAND